MSWAWAWFCSSSCPRVRSLSGYGPPEATFPQRYPLSEAATESCPFCILAGDFSTIRCIYTFTQEHTSIYLKGGAVCYAIPMKAFDDSRSRTGHVRKGNLGYATVSCKLRFDSFRRNANKAMQRLLVWSLIAPHIHSSDHRTRRVCKYAWKAVPISSEDAALASARASFNRTTVDSLLCPVAGVVQVKVGV